MHWEPNLFQYHDSYSSASSLCHQDAPESLHHSHSSLQFFTPCAQAYPPQGEHRPNLCVFSTWHCHVSAALLGPFSSFILNTFLQVSPVYIRDDNIYSVYTVSLGWAADMQTETKHSTFSQERHVNK